MKKLNCVDDIEYGEITVFVGNKIGCFTDSDYYIFPENNIHPIAQVKWVEEHITNHNIIICTNSPYIVEAIEVYSARNNIADKVKYYDVYDGNLNDCTDCIENIYQNFAQPFQNLENIRYRD